MPHIFEKEQLTFTGHARKYPHLPLALEALGIYHCQEYVSRPDGIDAWQWVQCIEGKGELVLDGKIYPIEEGHGILLPVRCIHDYYSITARWITNFLCINGALIDSITELYSITEPGVYQLSQAQKILDCEERIFELSQQNTSQNAFEISKLLYALLTDLSTDIKKSHSGQSKPGNAKIHDTINYMNQNYSHPITLNDIAAHAGLTREYLCQLFKSATASTVLEFLTQIRLAEAKTLLVKFPDKTLRKIAGMCGFESSSYFCYVFKKHEQMTPVQFRQSRR